MSSLPNKPDSTKKRSRWGGPPAAAASRISDEDALQALLTSAQAREREKQQQNDGAKTNSRTNEAESLPSKKIKTAETGRKHHNNNSGGARRDDYYGPASKNNTSRQDDSKLGVAADNSNDDDTTAVVQQKPNFGLSGALAKDQRGGGLYKGVLLKFQEPPEARTPQTLWRLYVFKNDQPIDTLHISKQSAFLIGRHADICDILVPHASCSLQHAVIQYRAVPHHETGRLNCQPYLMDLESTNGTFINGVRIDPARYYQFKKGDVLKFGASTREYVLLTANTTSI